MNCPDCNCETKANANFCSNCGNKLAFQAVGDYNKPLRSVFIFFFSLLAYIFLTHFSEMGDNYISVLVLDIVFASIILLFFFLHFKSNKSLLFFRKLNALVLLPISLGAFAFAFLVYFFAGYLNVNVFNQHNRIYYDQFIDSPAPLFFSILCIGFFPAVFEELAFRGIVFNHLTKISGVKTSILISSILFTILHLSFISALWIFPLALVMGYLRVRYRTLLYGIILHFIYNTSIVLIELYMQHRSV